jgi:hypothetical protein
MSKAGTISCHLPPDYDSSEIDGTSYPCREMQLPAWEILDDAKECQNHLHLPTASDTKSSMTQMTSTTIMTPTMIRSTTLTSHLSPAEATPVLPRLAMIATMTTMTVMVNLYLVCPQEWGGKATDVDDDDEDEGDDESDDTDSDNDDDDDESDDSDSDDNTRRVTINVKDEVISSPKSNMSTGVGAQNEVRRSAGVGQSQNNILPEITGVPSSSNVGVEQDDHDNTENANQDSSDNENETEDNTIMYDNDSVNREMDARYGPRNREGLHDRKPCSYSHRLGFDHSLATFKQPMGKLFLTEQVNVKKGLKVFGQPGAEAVVKELRQLDRLNTIEPRHSSDMT